MESTRLKKGTIQPLRKLGINIPEETRRFLEELAWKTDAGRTLQDIEEIISKRSIPSRKGFAVKSVREDRDEAH
jgi:hypothetical protein